MVKNTHSGTLKGRKRWIFDLWFSFVMELTLSLDVLYTLKPFPLWLHIRRATVFDFEGHCLLWTTVPSVTVQDLIPANCGSTLSDSA
jgi:hypothetical protein